MKTTQKMERIPKQKNHQSRDKVLVLENGQWNLSLTPKELKKLIVPMQCKMHSRTYKKTSEGIVVL